MEFGGFFDGFVDGECGGFGGLILSSRTLALKGVPRSKCVVVARGNVERCFQPVPHVCRAKLRQERAGSVVLRQGLEKAAVAVEFAGVFSGTGGGEFGVFCVGRWFTTRLAS